jgi:hypothetical protein
MDADDLAASTQHDLEAMRDALKSWLDKLTLMRDDSLLLRLVWNDLNAAVHGLNMVTDRTPPPEL